MRIISTNIAKPTIITWNSKEMVTGIYKKPIDSPIYLGKSDVRHDTVTDRKHHGGEFKACYLFSKDHYDYWKKLYPELEWNWGMFGENLTVEGLNEDQIDIGDIYKVGNALVQITQPREPCFKFGYKFGSQNALKQFIDHAYPGTYVRVLKEGDVKIGDEFELVEKRKNSISTRAFFNLLFSKNKDKNLIKMIENNDAIPQKKRDKLKISVEKIK